MRKLYTYVLRYDDGAAPNPFWGICTLTICKPVIRRTAKVGDWIIGLGSKRARSNDGKIHDFSGKIVYAMKISEIMPLKDYDIFCRTNYPNKISDWNNYEDWRLRMGDCIYDFSKGMIPILLNSVHNEWNKQKDLDGLNALISNSYYYFGENPIFLPLELNSIVFQRQGHRKFEDKELIDRFENWISQFEKNKLYSDPQMRFRFDLNLIGNKENSSCSCSNSLC